MEEIEFHLKRELEGNWRVILDFGDHNLLTWSRCKNGWGALWETIGREGLGWRGAA